MKQQMAAVAQQFCELFDTKTLEQLARSTGFVQRKGARLGVLQFVALLVLGRAGTKHPSLASMVDIAGGSIRRESLHGRFTKRAAAFMLACQQRLLRICSEPGLMQLPPLLSFFKGVKIFDSTGWEVAPGLAQHFAGSGGSSTGAACKVQACLEYASGTITMLKQDSGNVPDQKFGAQIPGLLQPGELILADLGYFCLQRLLCIIQMNAFFLSRLLMGTAIFDHTGQKSIDLLKLLKSATSNVLDVPVVLGAKKDSQVPCRLVCLRLEPEQIRRRRRAFRKTTVDKGKPPSALRLQLICWSVLVTNVPREQWPAQSLWHIYALRWQIELLFKRFKSIFAIHQSNTANPYRLLCELHGKLILCAMTQFLHACLNKHLWNTKHREVSADKLAKRIQERAFALAQKIISSVRLAVAYLKGQLMCFLPNCIKGRQPSRYSSIEAVCLLQPIPKRSLA